MYEELRQPRTVCRDSGYTTPPMIGNFSAKDNQKVCHNCFHMCRDAVIKNIQLLVWGVETVFIYHATKQSSSSIFSLLH